MHCCKTFDLENFHPHMIKLRHYVKEDMDDIIPMIKEAMEVSQDGFKIFASPWTC